jgi:hypothetical protein
VQSAKAVHMPCCGFLNAFILFYFFPGNIEILPCTVRDGSEERGSA